MLSERQVPNVARPYRGVCYFTFCMMLLFGLFSAAVGHLKSSLACMRVCLKAGRISRKASSCIPSRVSFWRLMKLTSAP